MIVGIIAAIAIPRMASAVGRSKASSVRANLRLLTGALDQYAAEHSDRTPDIDPDGKPETDETVIIQRVTMKIGRASWRERM